LQTNNCSQYRSGGHTFWFQSVPDHNFKNKWVGDKTGEKTQVKKCYTRAPQDRRRQKKGLNRENGGKGVKGRMWPQKYG
jgi:hypothetical protein